VEGEEEMKRWKSFLLLSGFLFLLPVTYAFSGSGSGTENNPYLIENVWQLQEINDNLSAYYALDNDIDATVTNSWNGGKGFLPIGTSTTPFIGSFDGCGHKIIRLYISREGTNYVGLFGYVDGTGKVGNIGLENVYVRGTNEVGGLVAHNNGTIYNSYSTGTVSGNVSGSDDRGVGGLVGRHYGKIYNSYSTGSVSGVNMVGGLVGANYGEIYNSYSTATAYASNFYVGGLVGVNCSTGKIYKSYSTGAVSGYGEVGGLVGDSSTGAVTSDSFWDIQTSGLTTSDGGTGKTTENMKNVRTYTDPRWSTGLSSPWDFVGNPYADSGTSDIWSISGGYPFLSFQVNQPPSTSNLLVDGENNPRVTRLSPTFSWSYSDPEGTSQSHYQIWIGVSPGSNNIWDSGQVASSATSVAYGGPPLSENRTYYIQVRTRDNYKWSNWVSGYFRTPCWQLGEAWAGAPRAIVGWDPVEVLSGAISAPLWAQIEVFSATSSAPVPPPALLASQEWENTSNPTPTFAWGNLLPADSFDLEVDNDADFGSLEISVAVSSTSYTPTSGLQDGLYRWRVRQWRTGVCSDWSEVRTFRIDTVVPPVPVLIYPPDGLQDNDSTPTFSWSSVGENSLPVTYRVRLSLTQDFSSWWATEWTEAVRRVDENWNGRYHRV
jgi:hypothetical protein